MTCCNWAYREGSVGGGISDIADLGSHHADAAIVRVTVIVDVSQPRATVDRVAPTIR